MKPATVLRTIKPLRAALNLAARHDRRIVNQDAWRDGLRPGDIVDTHNPRNVVLTDDQIKALIAEANVLDPALALYIETLAVTGNRPCQVAQLISPTCKTTR
jgi:integrase